LGLPLGLAAWADFADTRAMHVYFLGIAGAGMSALASLLISQGARVSGSDEAAFPPITTYLDRIGAPYHVGFDAAKVPADIDLAIIGASAKLGGVDNPELAELVRRGVPCRTFPEHLGALTAERDAILIAGSYGKSTLTAMLACLLREAGHDPGYFIGAVPLDLPTTGHWGSSPALVVEADEYVVSGQDRRSKFELYTPRHLLISSLQHDHVNMFATFADYVAPFARLIAATPADATIVAARGHPALQEITAGRQVVWYGLEDGPGYGATGVTIGETTRFTLLPPRGAPIPLATDLIGAHNIENIIGAAAMALELGLADAHAVQRFAAKFRGVARRLDKKTVRSRVPAYEGFGSSYDKARSAILALKAHFPDRPLVVVFEPHTFSWRNAAGLVWYDSVFDGAGEVVLLPPPGHGAGGHDQIDQAAIAARIAAAGVTVTPAPSGAGALAHLEAKLPDTAVVLLLSSGPLDGLADTLPAWLDQRFGA
jgi:UDP-N-acetylmuramate: L-alanyl-gamma-D-glutamyl-meso-diaminopimelate ligase